MIPQLREQFNSRFDPKIYQRFLKDIDSSCRNSLVFRVSESPLFLSEDLSKKLMEASWEVFRCVQSPDYNEKVAAAVPPGMSVANEDDHTTFLQIDFAVCRDPEGGFYPQLIELQGFPSLYCFQHFLDSKFREYFDIPEDFSPYFSRLDSQGYKETLGKVLLGDCDPENVILLEYQPHQQKTRIDFYLTEEYYGIRPVCLTEVYERGHRLYYRQDGREIPIERVYHRFIFDELLRSGVEFNFPLHDEELQVKWVGHPNWFFKISKFTLPLIESRYCSPCYYLKDLQDYPEDLENYVLKPLFSFAGKGVVIDLSRELLDSLPNKENYLLQKRVQYAPLLKSPDGYSMAEIRMMFVWDREPLLINNLLRLSQGKMMGVDYNKDKTWVGSSVAYHPPLP